jgi:hypothetical protein
MIRMSAYGVGISVKVVPVGAAAAAGRHSIVYSMKAVEAASAEALELVPKLPVDLWSVQVLEHALTAPSHP